MFFVRLIRFLKGYVIFTCRGGFPERFINLCSLYGINLWDARSVGGVITAKTDLKSYKKIRPCVRNSGMKAKINQKCGLPFFIRPYLRRKGLFAGCIISAVLLVFLTSCIWTVEVKGNEKFTREQILTIVENYGIFSSAMKNNIDAKDLKTRVTKEWEGINWFSANIDGAHVSVELTETENSKEIIDTKTPCNVISSVDGEIISITAHYGKAAVKAGNAVTAGDLLISGVMERDDGSVYFVHARGSAVIRTNKKTVSEIPLYLPVKKVTEVKNVNTVTFFGLKIPLGRKQAADLNVSRTFMLTYGETVLPAGLIRDTQIFLKNGTADLSERQARLLGGYRLSVSERLIMANAETEKKTVSVKNDEKVLTLSADYINHETTGTERFFEISEED